MGGKTCKVLEPLNLLLVSPEYLEGLIFSATMPKAKNQSRRVYCFLWGFTPPFFASFFKKEEWGFPFNDQKIFKY